MFHNGRDCVACQPLLLPKKTNVKNISTRLIFWLQITTAQLRIEFLRNTKFFIHVCIFIYCSFIYFLHSAFSTLLIFNTPHFPHSAFSTLRIFHTPHFPHSSFSTLLIFHTPHFPHSSFSTLRTPHSSFSTEPRNIVG